MNDELINRSELLTAISRYSTLTNQVWPMWIEAVINTEPAIDAVPVVRCKDCIYYKLYPTGRNCIFYKNFIHYVDADDYCSKGMKMDEKEHSL